MTIANSRLSALPGFFKSSQFWAGALDPSLSIDDAATFRHLREFSCAHSWDISADPLSKSVSVEGTDLTAIEVALGILQRGAWTLCSWMVEKWTAQQLSHFELCSFEQLSECSGMLGFDATQNNPDALRFALISGRLQSELEPNAVSSIWRIASELTGEQGSWAEKRFFEEVLVPVLGFPLLDYLRFQTDLKDLGVSGTNFTRQRTDFSIDTGRGLRLVIEVDGRQHHEQDAQKLLDLQRDAALNKRGWRVWRVPVMMLQNTEGLRIELMEIMHEQRHGCWGIGLRSEPERTALVMRSVWGATVVARIQFLLLESMRQGLLATDKPLSLYINERETEVRDLAIIDFGDWFGRLRRLYGLSEMPEIGLVDSHEKADLAIWISCANPYYEPETAKCPVAFSRPFNAMASEPAIRFTSREYVPHEPAKDLVESFVRDFFRKRDLREGQYEILSRVLTGRDAVGLLPTGGGKSLTYQIASLLLPGATLYVAPLKSLLQDQYERMKLDGIDGCGFISSALSTKERQVQEGRFTSGALRLLQVAPERFLMENFRSLLHNYQSKFGVITQVVVDECHCVSEWGHDFRPAYLSLSRIIKDRTTRLGSSAPVLALTGTASSIVLDDVRRELGIGDTAANIRAKRLDRPELDLQFVKLPSKDKPDALALEVHSFIERFKGSNGGLLVFSQHINGEFGVFEIATNLAQRLDLMPGRDVRIYSGEVPKLIRDTFADGEWDTQKAQAQREFVNPRSKQHFNILVCTGAFGMGIDKPSIRKVIHYLSPQSPEAYYQEVGRAARDREPATAVLLFSDEHSHITNHILSPGTDIDDARKAHAAIPRNTPVGDFLTTFYFHANRFKGVTDEVNQAVMGLKAIKRLLKDGDSVVLHYEQGRDLHIWNAQSPLEYTLVRLIHLGVVLDYTKDFNSRTFDVKVSPEWIASQSSQGAYRERFIEMFGSYLKRYETRRLTPLIEDLLAATSVEEIEFEALKAIIKYLYSQIEHRRRTSTRTMLEMAREGVTDRAKARERLLFYLQASDKFTHDLEHLVKTGNESSAWMGVALSAESPVEIDELRGATARVLESYPTHPGLLFLSALTRRNPSSVEKDRSTEDFLAALNIVIDRESNDAATVAAEEALACCWDIDADLATSLSFVYGLWSFRRFGARFALNQVGGDLTSQMGVVNEMLKVAIHGIPVIDL